MRGLKKTQLERGAILSEYAIVLGILTVVFFTAGVLFFNAATSRANVGADAVRNSLPCTDVSGEGALDADSPDCL